MRTRCTSSCATCAAAACSRSACSRTTPARSSVAAAAHAAPCPAKDDDDEFWDHELLDLDVHDVDGRALGTVADVLHPPGSDLLVVRRPDGGELFVPFVSAIVPTVDLAARRIVVDPPEG